MNLISVAIVIFLIILTVALVAGPNIVNESSNAGNTTVVVRNSNSNTKSSCACGPKSGPTQLYPDAFWEDGDAKAPAGFGLSSGEIQYQLPHPKHPLQTPSEHRQRLHIDMDRKTRLGYPKNPSCTCESVGDLVIKAAAYPKYVWEQPAPIMNYFESPYPEDDASSPVGMKLTGDHYADFRQSGIDMSLPTYLSYGTGDYIY